MVNSPPLQNDAKSVDSANDLWRAIDKFLHWLQAHGYESYDPYDIWGTSFGCFARRVYYKFPLAGVPLVAPFLLLEKLAPGARRLLVSQKRYAIVDAQLALAFLNIFHLTGDRTFLDKAITLGKDLQASSLPGYSGYCWGYPFAWQHAGGLWEKDRPYITTTPYCFETFLGLADATGQREYLEVAQSIAHFVHKDLRDTPTSPDAAAASYSPLDNTRVLNTSAYRAMVLYEAAARFGEDAYRATAEKNLNFILQNQRPDGAWLYSLDESEQFIDHFHTCFVLKNLAKINHHLESPAVESAIRRGYEYYRAALFDAEGLPKAFAIKPRTEFIRMRMYDVAEAITLGTVLRDQIPDAMETARHLAEVVCQKCQLPDGHFVTNFYVGGMKHAFPFLRWPQAQLFYALTNVLRTDDSPVENKTPTKTVLSGKGVSAGIDPAAPGRLTYWDQINDARWGEYLIEREREVITRGQALAAKPGYGIDLGCGSGRWSSLLAGLGWKMTSIDVDPHSLAICQRNVPSAICIQADPADVTIPCTSQSSNLVVCIEVAPAIQAPWFLPECARVLTDQGLIIGVWWNRRSWRWLGWKAKQVLTGKAAPHAFYKKPYAEWKRDLHAAGFKILHDEGFSWAPFDRASNSPLIPLFTKLERWLGLHRWVSFSPWVLFIAQKQAGEAARR